MAKMFVLTNHELTEEQKNDAINTFGVNEFIHAPERVLATWGYIPPHYDEVKEYLRTVFKWLESAEPNDDIVLVQGESVSTYQVVDTMRKLKIRCIAATTERVTEEVTMPDGSVQKKSVFKHVRFRPYF
jgi:hypothetical protein